MKQRPSMIRWPYKIYEQVRELAYRKRQSINKTVIELTTKALAQENKR